MYDINLVNKGAFADGSTVSVWSSASGSASILYTADDFAGILTGNYSTSLGAKWYQLLSLDGANIYGYVREDTVIIKTVNPITTSTAQGTINQMIDNDKQTLTNLLIAAEYCKRLQAKGYNVSSQKAQIKKTYLSLYNRNKKLADAPGFSDKQKGKSNLTGFAPALQNIVNDSNIGIVISTAVLITIIVVALVAGATAVYYAFYIDAKNASKDLQVSENLKKALENVDASTRETIIKELQEQINDAYNSGKFSGLNWFDILKYGAVAVGTFFVIKYVRENL